MATITTRSVTQPSMKTTRANRVQIMLHALRAQPVYLASGEVNRRYGRRLAALRRAERLVKRYEAAHGKTDVKGVATIAELDALLRKLDARSERRAKVIARRRSLRHAA